MYVCPNVKRKGSKVIGWIFFLGLNLQYANFTRPGGAIGKHSHKGHYDMDNWGWSETSSRLRWKTRFWDLSGSYNPCKWWYDKCYLPLLNNQGVEVSAPADPESGGHWENTTVKPPPAADGYSPCQPLLVEGLLNEARENLRDEDGNIHIPPDNATELRSYKVRLYLTKEQKKTAQLWMDAADWSYDQAVVGMQQVGYDLYDSKDMNEMKAKDRKSVV